MEMYSHGSTSSSSSITTKPSSGDDYEVFLSFRGPDTRTGFTDHLYHSLTDAGVHVFKDDEELRVGQEISSNLTDAINKSKISIPIFSKGYASSKWCLQELVRIAENRKTSNQIVMPIFYTVSPSDVRHHTGSFEEAFRLHECSFSEEIVGKWKEALKEIGSLKGWDFTSGRQFEAEIIKEVVDRVLRHLKKSYVVVTDFLVGVEDRVEYIKSIISAGSREEKIVGLYGPGGIGKTTLAKIVYNQLSNDFEGCSFLANVRETSNLKDTGIIRLQNQLISNVLRSGVSTVNSVDEGIATIKERLSRKKVLICFDDVSERKQLEALARDSSWFGPGSRIIITTRNKELLNEVRAYSSYEVTEMDFDRSLQLFSKLAFRRDRPPPNYMTYSEKVVKLTGGLPLALEVIGSLLHGKPKDSWAYNLEKLEKVPHKDVQQSLMISYEELDDGQKQMFLDVCCFFVGFNKTVVLYFWDSNIYPREGMEVLEHMSLLKIKEDNSIWMHDQLIDFGRSMTFEKGNSVKQENRSRSCVNEEAVSILKKGMKEERVEAMHVSWDELHEFGFRRKISASVPSLMLLQVTGYSFQKKPRRDWGSWTNSTVLPQLRWLILHKLDPQWWRIKLCACNLAILDLSFSKVTHKWEGWNQIKVAMNLKVLNLTGCIKLKRTPNLSAHVKLERLILCDCDELVRIDKSIGRLKRLLFLDLGGCNWLRQLPEEIGQLESLIELVLSKTRVRVLPGSVGNIKSLKVLRLSYSHISELATGIGRAENLEEICFESCCYLTEIPSEIGRLSSLLKLNISGQDSKISQVPKLPKSLIYLHLEFKRDGPNNEVPDLSNLVNLRELVLTLYRHREAAPSLLWWIGRLSKLETLTLTSYDAPHLSNDLGSLSLLKTLHLKRCYKLQSLPRLPSSLLDLCIDGCSAIRDPLDISNLNRLLKFRVRNCGAITEIWGLPSSLAELDLSGCESLNSIGDISNLKRLSTLSVYCCGVTEMRGLDCLENLRFLSLADINPLKRLPEDLSHLSQLKKLMLWDLPWLQGLPRLPRLPSGLESLIIRRCQFAHTWIDVSNLKSLVRLMVTDSTLREICGLEHLEKLQVMSLERVSGLESLPPFPSNLKELSLFVCEHLLCLPRLPQSLVKLQISSCPIHMLDVSDLTELKELRITSHLIKEIRRLHCLVNLTHCQFNGRVYSEPDLEFLQILLSGPPFGLTVTD